MTTPQSLPRVLRDPATGLYLARWLGRWTWTAQRHKAHSFGRGKSASGRLRGARTRYPRCIEEAASLPAPR